MRGKREKRDNNKEKKKKERQSFGEVGNCFLIRSEK